MKKLSMLFNQVILTFAFCTLVFSFQSCNDRPKEKEQTVPGFNLTTAKAEIEEANKIFMALVTAGDSIGIANMYTTDAKAMFAGKPADVGRPNIQTTFSRMLNSGVTKLDLNTIEVFGTEDLLVEEGEVTVYVRDKAVEEGKYIVLWKREDGKWKLFRDIVNSN